MPVSSPQPCADPAIRRRFRLQRASTWTSTTSTTSTTITTITTSTSSKPPVQVFCPDRDKPRHAHHACSMRSMPTPSGSLRRHHALPPLPAVRAVVSPGLRPQASRPEIRQWNEDCGAESCRVVGTRSCWDGAPASIKYRQYHRSTTAAAAGGAATVGCVQWQ